MKPSLPFVHWQKLPPLVVKGSPKVRLLGASLFGVGLFGATLLGGTLIGVSALTPAWANEPTSLLNPKIEPSQPSEKILKDTTDSTQADNTKNENTGGETGSENTQTDGANSNAPRQQSPEESPEESQQKTLENLLDELNTPPNYSEETQSPTTPVAGSIQTEQLQTISHDSFGLIEPNQDNITLWNNTRYSHLMALVQQSTLSITSPTLYQSVMDTLLLGATAPALDSPYKQGDYILARVALLSRAGHIKTAKQLLSQSPIGTSPEHKGHLLDLTLLQHDIPSACLLSKELSLEKEMPATVDPLLVKQLGILCKGISDNPATAYIAASALQETSEDVSFLFVDTLDYLNNGPAPDEQSLTQLTPFTLLLARLTSMPINKDLLTKASPDVLRSVAAHPNTADDARIYALEQLAHTGAISATELSDGYGRITFTDEQLQDPLTALYELTPPLRRALLVRTSKGEDGWKNGITLLNRIQKSEDYIMISNVLAADFAKLSPAPHYETAATVITRSLLASGYTEQAQLWYDARGQFETATSNAIGALYPALLLASQTTNSINLDDADTKAWAEQMSKYKGHGLKAFTRGLSVLDTLGFDIDERLWDYLDAPFLNTKDTFLALPNSGVTLLEKFAQSGRFAPKAPPAIPATPEVVMDQNSNETSPAEGNTQGDIKITPLSDLAQSAHAKKHAKKQRGMTALYAMNLVGTETASNLSDGQVIRIINALKHGLGDDVARSYALEALVRQYTPRK